LEWEIPMFVVENIKGGSSLTGSCSSAMFGDRRKKVGDIRNEIPETGGASRSTPKP
jgi:hypothetical protein